MSRKHAPSTPTKPSLPRSLPTPAPLNIATREYYRPSATLDAHDADIEYPLDLDDRLTSPPAAPQRDPFELNATVRSQDVCDFVEMVKVEGTHSPTPSDVVLSCHVEDTQELSALERELRGRGVAAAERKRALLELQDELVASRKKVAEEAEKVRLEELEREYEETQRKGREEV